MPETFGKRQRQGVKARKAAAREERRLARTQRREAIAAGLLDPDPWLGSANPAGDEDPSTADQNARATNGLTKGID